ncbi:hypothetical protein VNO77_39202 [Canavalia gladiata]|uniref:Uncharacterized protein n=1 Tax=Canavalia gladiata TaxID=3824 RepID=A0AAN9KAN5_CANGL
MRADLKWSRAGNLGFELKTTYPSACDAACPFILRNHERCSYVFWPSEQPRKGLRIYIDFDAFQLIMLEPKQNSPKLWHIKTLTATVAALNQVGTRLWSATHRNDFFCLAIVTKGNMQTGTSNRGVAIAFVSIATMVNRLADSSLNQCPDFIGNWCGLLLSQRLILITNCMSVAIIACFRHFLQEPKQDQIKVLCDASVEGFKKHLHTNMQKILRPYLGFVKRRRTPKLPRIQPPWFSFKSKLLFCRGLSLLASLSTTYDVTRDLLVTMLRHHQPHHGLSGVRPL